MTKHDEVSRLVMMGFDPASAIEAVRTGDLRKLQRPEWAAAWAEVEDALADSPRPSRMARLRAVLTRLARR